MKLVIVDYGMGNISSIVSAFRFIGIHDISVSNDIDVLRSADKLILPGVGNYSTAIKKIRELNIINILHELVYVEKKPILGICLGMQILGKSSTEGGFNHGFGLVDGVVEKFSLENLKVPHVGFNQITLTSISRLYTGLSENPDFYFTHSYKMSSNSDIGQQMCDYGEDFVASFEIDNIAGVQFHPELSQNNGLMLLKNFIELF
tara:strand:+ start:3876 stop:4487 length:612 start_codon:yes stop_codon:yes gene_type:complete